MIRPHLRALIFVALFALLVGGGSALAQGPTGRWTLVGEDTAGDWLVYATGDHISAIAPDGDRIWAASTGGLLSWDRRSGDLAQYLAPQVPLPGNNLDQLLLHDGKLYISGRGGVTVFDRRSHWQTYRRDAIGLDADDYGPLAMVGDVLWVGSSAGLARLHPDGHWEALSGGPGSFPLTQVRRIVPRDDGVYLEAGDPHAGERSTVVVRYADDRWERLETPLPAHLVAPDGTLWKGEGDTLVRSCDGGASWQVVYEGRFVEARAVDGAGRVYASDDRAGVLVVEGDRVVERYRFTDLGPELSFINVMRRDEAGRMWIGTDGRGLTMYDGARWHNWQPETSGLREDAIRGLAVAGDRVYCGVFSGAAAGGVSIYDAAQDEWTNLWPEASPLSGGGVGGIAIDRRGRAYLPTSAGMLDIYDQGRWRHVRMTPWPQREIVTTEAGLFDAGGHYWLATGGRGIWRYDGSRWMAYNTSTASLPCDAVNALAVDPKGRLWAATVCGLAVREAHGTWWAYTPERFPVLGSGWLDDVAIDGEGRVWTVHRDGLVVFNGREWRSFAPQVAGASMWSDAIAFDGRGRAWVAAGSFGGVAIFQGQLDMEPFRELALRGEVPMSPAASWAMMGRGAVACCLCLLIALFYAVVVALAFRRRPAADERAAPAAGAGGPHTPRGLRPSVDG